MSEVTCQFAELVNGEAVPRYCLAPAFAIVRWRYSGADGFEFGALCMSHVFPGCEQLAADTDIVPESIELRRA